MCCPQGGPIGLHPSSPHRSRDAGSRLTRRRFLRLAGAAAGGTVILSVGGTRSAGARRAKPHPWSEPSTWGGSVPGPNDVAVVRRTVILDVNAQVAGVVIERGAKLIFDPARSRTLESSGNVVVEGRLRMRPESSRRTHTLRITGVDEAGFVGGGHEVLDSDRGVWVRETGSLDAVGASKRAWARATSGLAVGATSLTLDADPDGWAMGDEIAICPTEPSDVAGSSYHFEVRSVTAIDGRTVSWTGGLGYPHPATTVDGTSWHTEVLNLTRNVRIEGTETGRSHTHIMSMKPQKLRRVAWRYMGPRKAGGGATEPVLGRYAVHFHEAGSDSQGSLVQGCVNRDGGSHSFVPHASHGITFKDDIVYNCYESAFWWDPGERSDSVTFEGCVAASILTEQASSSQYTLSGFVLGVVGATSPMSEVTGCVATGVQGAVTTSGFLWPSKANDSPGMWAATDSVAHNNAMEGIYTWQNTTAPTAKRFVLYSNGENAIDHGAYVNRFEYSDISAFGNGGRASGGVNQGRRAELSIHAVNSDFIDLFLDAGGRAPQVIKIQKHALGASRSSVLLGCTVRGWAQFPITVDERGGEAGLCDFVRTRVDATNRDLHESDFNVVFMAPGSRIRMQSQDDGSAFQITPDDQGRPVFATIAPFYP